MSVAKQIPQDHCLLLALNENTLDGTSGLKLIRKKFPKAYHDVSQLMEQSNVCAQNVCLVVTDNTPLLLKSLKENYDTIKKGAFFLISIDLESFKVKGTIKKLIVQHRILNIQGLNLEETLALIDSNIRVLKKEVKIFLRKNMLQGPNSKISSVDFLAKFNALLKKYYSNPKLRTPLLAEKLGISQSTLERRCIKLTGKNPNHILLEFRLSRAYELAAHTRTNFSQIASLCGFGSASYFSVRFTEFYKLKPSHVRMQFQRRNAS